MRSRPVPDKLLESIDGSRWKIACAYRLQQYRQLHAYGLIGLVDFLHDSSLLTRLRSQTSPVLPSPLILQDTILFFQHPQRLMINFPLSGPSATVPNRKSVMARSSLPSKPAPYRRHC